VGFGEVLIVMAAPPYFAAGYQRKRSGATLRRVV
jgi:hypothetical protein